MCSKPPPSLCVEHYKEVGATHWICHPQCAGCTTNLDWNKQLRRQHSERYYYMISVLFPKCGINCNTDACQNRRWTLELIEASNTAMSPVRECSALERSIAAMLRSRIQTFYIGRGNQHHSEATWQDPFNSIPMWQQRWFMGYMMTIQVHWHYRHPLASLLLMNADSSALITLVLHSFTNIHSKAWHKKQTFMTIAQPFWFIFIALRSRTVLGTMPPTKQIISLLWHWQLSGLRNLQPRDLFLPVSQTPKREL